MRRLSSTCVAGALALAAQASGVRAEVVADYQDEFRVTGGPAPGWSYLWNANGPIGNPANYVPLVADNGRYESVANGAYPDPDPGSTVAAGSAPVDPAKFPRNPPPDPFGSGAELPPLPQTFVRPGRGTAQLPNTVERAAVVAYTFSAEEVAANGGRAFFTDYYFAVSSDTADPVTARVFHDDDPTPILDFTFPAGFAFHTSLDPDPIPLGTYAAGETVYIAIGSFATDGSVPGVPNSGDELRLDFTISLIPEPGSEPWRVADANGDGKVDVADLGILATNYNESPPDPPGRAGGDFNADGRTDVSDLGILATHYGQPMSGGGASASNPAAVPEPAAFGLLCLPALGLLARRRR